MDVFVKDGVAGRIRRVSVGPFGESANRSEASSIDARGLVDRVPLVRLEPRLRRPERKGRRLRVRPSQRSHGTRQRLLDRRRGACGHVPWGGQRQRRFVGFRSRASQSRSGGHEQRPRRVRPRPLDRRHDADQRLVRRRRSRCARLRSLHAPKLLRCRVPSSRRTAATPRSRPARPTSSPTTGTACPTYSSTISSPERRPA